MRRCFISILVLSICWSSVFAAGRRPPPSNLDSIPVQFSYLPQVQKMADRYRLTIQTPESLPHYLIEKTPRKIWLRLVRPSTDESQILEGDSVIREVRLVQKQYSADMIMKLGEDAVANDVYFDEGKKKIVVDVFTSNRIKNDVAQKPAVAQTETPVLKTKKVAHAKHKTEKKIVAAPAPVIVPAPAAASAPAIVAAPVVSASATRTEPKITRRPSETVVVIDAGHGGMDCGAIGTRGTLEKDINLDFARQLAKMMTKEKNVRVVMTRDNDEFVALQDRTRIANDAEADLFVSIHCNASLSPKNTGFETYFLSPDATDKAAASVARLENSVVSLEAHKGAPSSRLSELLASMAIGNFINESSKFASIVCRTIHSHTSVDKAEVKEADFFVLRGAQMPAVLIELEYLSNPISELKLRSSRYRSQLVKGVVEGIKAYNHQARQEREASLH